MINPISNSTAALPVSPAPTIPAGETPFEFLFRQKFGEPTPAAAPATESKAATEPKPAAAWVPQFEQNLSATLINGVTVPLNSDQFATPETAAHVAAELGGQVGGGSIGSGLPDMLQITGAGANTLNAGLVAKLFEHYGDAPGSQAWAVIDSDLGKPDTFAGVQPTANSKGTSIG